MQRIYGIYLHMSEKNTIFASAFVGNDNEKFFVNREFVKG